MMEGDVGEGTPIEQEPLERPMTARRTFTLRSGAARQVAVNFMPSRQLSYNTLRLRRANSEHNALLEDAVDAPESGGEEMQADLIVRGMEQHQRLMENSPQSEELRREALRDLPQGLTMKRTVRAKLSASVSLRSRTRPISLMKRLKYRISFAFKRLHDRVRDLSFSVELWYEAIRTIEGQYGSAVGSYFRFVRWLFALDVALCALLVAFVVVPQALHAPHGNSTLERGFVDFVAGQGFLEDSLLFYGHYDDGDVSTGSISYHMPFAYFFTMVCLYLTFFGVLCYRTADSYRRNFIETSGTVGLALAGKLFCGWDFGINTASAAAHNAASVYREFKELLDDLNKNQVSTLFWTKVWRWFVNAIFTALVLGLIVALEYGLWLLLATEQQHLPNWRLLVSATIVAALAICPMIFSLVSRLEYYEPRTALYVALCRTWLLDSGTLLLVLVYWSQSGAPCWETSVGQEAYRLVVLDAVVSLLLVPLLEFSRAMLFKYNHMPQAPEFNIAYNSLTVIYNQAVLWLGMLFAPLLVVAVTFKFLLLFYVKRECAIRACQPSRKVWRAAQTQTVFYMLVSLSLFVTLFAIGSIFLRMPSQYCGPFREYSAVYGVLTNGVLQLDSRASLARVLGFFVRPGAVAFMLLALCVCVWYMRARALGRRGTVAVLRHMLRLHHRDKDFLLAAVGKVSRGEWLYSPRTEPEGPDSHTWKYLKEVRKPSNAEFHFDASRLNHSLLEGRPRSYVRESRPLSMQKVSDDGDTDSSFSWQGSSNQLNQRSDPGEGSKKWF